MFDPASVDRLTSPVRAGPAPAGSFGSGLASAGFSMMNGGSESARVVERVICVGSGVSTVSEASEGVSTSRRAVAARNKRANETPEEAEERKRRRRDADRARREARQQSQRQDDVAIAEQQRERNRVWLAASRVRASDAQRQARRVAEAARAAAVRSQENDSERQERLSQMAVRAALARSQEDDVERSQRLMEANRSQNRRSNESENVRDGRLANLRASFRAAQRVVQAANLSIGRRVREPDVNDIGNPDGMCELQGIAFRGRKEAEK
ncbi:hypothetical protein L596_027976 [Steinernema carpocapsae]|uniref:Uncharacterized protein n=1 Tax=Steinernema carpocapsae TaxID=34508 RepID=A0A4U5LX28_STECR|nr:hypothetical protein L596_027976 [Steinernema carpocapsae]